ncbi:MAG TPA: gamma-glutamylcyclotransferase family protein [Polyangiaceae bacterium]|jgi:gamma-glutamylcyclotransferase (GGCT)/AIG2-like uncharacterized protein YtfP|nr:gamma-glutamylcyclotransferase family protein [Polyangiaceae bacterium]
MAQPIRFFVYGPLLAGEPEHGKLDGATLVGPRVTVSGYSLVEVGPLAGLVREGQAAVHGEVYLVEAPTLTRLLGEHPALYALAPVELEGGEHAETLLLDEARARGKRRIRGGDWRTRFGPAGVPGPRPAGPLVTWARTRRR